MRPLGRPQPRVIEIKADWSDSSSSRIDFNFMDRAQAA